MMTSYSRSPCLLLCPSSLPRCLPHYFSLLSLSLSSPYFLLHPLCCSPYSFTPLLPFHPLHSSSLVRSTVGRRTAEKTAEKSAGSRYTFTHVREYTDIVTL